MTRVISLDNMVVDPVYEELFHRPGCSIQRTGRCICEYLAQWDEPNYGAECVKALDDWVILNNPEHRWVPGDQLPPRQTGR